MTVNNNRVRTPLWLQEILTNGDVTASFSLFDDTCLFASCTVEDPTVRLHYSHLPHLQPNGVKRIAFSWDGPFLESTLGGTTGAITSVLGEMEALVDAGFEVYLFYCYRGWSDPKLYPGRKFSTIFIRPEDFYDNRELMGSLIQSYRISIFQIDSAEAVNWQGSFVKPHAKVVFEVHNIQTSLLQQTSASKEVVEYIKDMEIKAVEMADLVLLRSETDMMEMKKLSPRHEHMRVYRGCISLENIKLVPKRPSGNAVFMGHLNYEPNIQALDLIATQIAPYLSGKCFIVGLCSQGLQKKYASEKMVFLNWVDDLSEVFARVDIALAPITSGSGTAIKVLDYMAHHLPVIGTSLAVRGLEKGVEDAMIVENDISKYPGIIGELLGQPEVMKLYANKGCSFVKRHRDWKTGISDVIKAYQSLEAQNSHIWVSLEGMPRAGKSTTYNRLTRDYKTELEASPEIFFTQAYYDSMTDKTGTVQDSLWLLDQEGHRKHQLSGSSRPVFLADRCYLSTLAYTYASSVVKNDLKEFEAVEEYFLKNRGNYPDYKVVFVFDTDPLTTFERREEREAPHNVLWMSEAFMKAYRRFYQEEIGKYTRAKIVRIGEHLDLDEIYRIVSATLEKLLSPRISVILCTHNDIDGLSTTVKALEEQTIGTENFEVIIVDNASSPPIFNAVQRLSLNSPLIIRLIFEPKLGLSNARNTGIAFAKSPQVAITDPENVPDPNWLLTICETLENNPQTQLIGGKLEDVVHGSLPWYFPSELTEYFTPTLWPKNVEPITFPYFATGANMAFRAAAFEAVKGFNPFLGRNGKRLLSCEDLEFKIKIQQKYGSAKCVIHPEAVVTHITSSKMFSFKNLIYRAYYQGVSEARMLAATEDPNMYNNRSLSVLVGSLADTVVNLMIFNVPKSVYNLFIVVLNVGYLTEIFCKKLHELFGAKKCDSEQCYF